MSFEYVPKGNINLNLFLVLLCNPLVRITYQFHFPFLAFETSLLFFSPEMKMYIEFHQRIKIPIFRGKKRRGHPCPPITAHNNIISLFLSVLKNPRPMVHGGRARIFFVSWRNPTLLPGTVENSSRVVFLFEWI